MYATCANLLNLPRFGRGWTEHGSAGNRGRDAHGLARWAHIHVSYSVGLSLLPPSNEAVTAETFRHSLERSLSPKNRFSWVSSSRRTSSASPRIGAGEAAHISGVAAHGNTLSITIVKPAGDFLTRISMLAFCPVPLSMPVHGRAQRSGALHRPVLRVLGQGNRTVLLRNPNYHGDRPRRSERIVYANDIPTPKAVALVDGGDLDLLPWDFSNTTSLLGVQRRARSSVRGAQRRPHEPAAAVFPLSGAACRLHRPQHAASVVPRRPHAPCRQLRSDRSALAASFARRSCRPDRFPGSRWLPAGRIYPLTGPDLVTALEARGRRQRRAVLYSAVRMRDSGRSLGLSGRISLGSASRYPSRRRTAVRSLAPRPPEETRRPADVDRLAERRARPRPVSRPSADAAGSLGPR